MVAATSSWITVIDNLSAVPDWLSDAIARLSTGGGLATRELYTDDEPYLFDACRPVLMNGITDVITRPDLLDRSVILSVPRLEAHCNERDLWAEFEEVRPGILGVLLDAVACALKNLPDVQRHGLPRMADFCRWAMAAMPALSQTPEAFLSAYKSNRAAVNRLALEASPVAEAVLGFMADRDAWTGIAAELLEELAMISSEAVRRDDRSWPRTARGLSGHLRRVAPNLRRQGVEIVFSDRSNARRELRLERLRNEPSQPSQPSPPQVDGVTVGVTVEPSPVHQPSSQPSPQKPRSEGHRDGSDGSDGPTQAQSSPEQDEVFEQEEGSLAALRAGLGAVEAETLDYIGERRRDGADFTQITAELNRGGFPPPPWRARWELQDTVQVHGWRR